MWSPWKVLLKVLFAGRGDNLRPRLLWYGTCAAKCLSDVLEACLVDNAHINVSCCLGSLGEVTRKVR